MRQDPEERGAFDPARHQAERALMTRGEAVRLLAMLMVLVFCVGYILYVAGGSAHSGGAGDATVPATTYQVSPERLPADEELDAGKVPEAMPAPRPPSVPPFTEDPALVEAIVDDSEGLDDPGFYHLLHKVAAMDDAALEGAATEGFERDDFWYAAGTLRGRALTIRGTLYDHYPWLLETRPNESGYELVYRGLLIDHKQRPMQFVVLDKDMVFEKGKTHIELSGIFYKLLKFQTAKEDRIGHQPVLIARRLRPFVPPSYEESYPMGLAWFASGVALAAIAGIAFLVTGWRRRDERFREAFRARHPRKVDNEALRKQVSPAWRKQSDRPGAGRREDGA